MPLGGRVSSRPLHFVWILDRSGSMRLDGKVQALNNAIAEALPHMRRVADENPHARLLVRAVAFSTGAMWHVAKPTPIEEFAWSNIVADGVSDLGAALQLVGDALQRDEMPERALPPVLVLVSDGQPTDDWRAGYTHLMDQAWGKKARRIAVAIGRDADVEMLERFVGDRDYPVLQANCAEDLVSFIKWASTAVVKSASQVSPGHSSESAQPRLEAPDPGAGADALTW